MSVDKKYFINKNVLAFSCVILVFWMALIIIAPVLLSSNKQIFIKIGEWIYFFCQPTCHQMPERSFLINDIPMAVCIRCLSFYIGGLILFIIYFFKKTISEEYIKWIIILCIPALLDFIMEKTDTYENIEEFRIITGILLGVSIFYMILLSLSQIEFKNVKVNA